MSKQKIKGTYTTTRKTRLYTNYIEFLKVTQEIYNETIFKYYNLLLEHLDLLSLSNQKCLRELEKLTIQNKNGEKPENYFDLDVPVYLRRSAINQAIGVTRSYIAKLDNYEEKIQSNPKISKPQKAKQFNAGIVFYKGMYKKIADDTIKIKLFNGNSWQWYLAKVKYPYFSDEENVLSPTIVLDKKCVMIHIPIKKDIEDVRPIQTRMQKKHIRICGIAFSNSDSFAICVVLDENRNLINTKFIKGGNEYKARTSKILAQIKKHRQNGKNFGVKDHKKYWEKLNNISNWYAHEVSKEIVDFCKENKVEVISMADMSEDINNHFGKRVGKYSPIYLSKRISSYLKYKAFQNSILITKVRKNYTGNKCYICRGNVKRKKLKYECENGHSGDYFFNSAMNIGIMCLKKFGK